jgi:hypothetical protein
MMFARKGKHILGEEQVLGGGGEMYSRVMNIFLW